MFFNYGTRALIRSSGHFQEKLCHQPIDNVSLQPADKNSQIFNINNIIHPEIQITRAMISFSQIITLILSSDWMITSSVSSGGVIILVRSSGGTTALFLTFPAIIWLGDYIVLYIRFITWQDDNILIKVSILI
jgi:hypothetical protein